LKASFDKHWDLYPKKWGRATGPRVLYFFYSITELKSWRRKQEKLFCIKKIIPLLSKPLYGCIENIILIILFKQLKTNIL